MKAIDVICKRVSVAQLTGNELSQEQIETLINAALRAADHARMRPSRYLVIQGDERAKLGELFLASQENLANLSSVQQQKMRSLLLRAPTVIVAVCKTQPTPKIPELEQQLSTAAGVQNMLNAAWAMGLGAIWRTGDMAYSQVVKEALGLTIDEQIIGFVYVGEANCQPKPVPKINCQDFYAYWSADK